MIYFIEGPHTDERTELFSQLTSMLSNMTDVPKLAFYDTLGPGIHGDGEPPLEDAVTRMELAIEMSHYNEHVTMMVNNGPLTLLTRAFHSQMGDLVHRLHKSFSNIRYQRIFTISIIPEKDNAALYDTYFEVLPKYMATMSDGGKKNSYRQIMHPRDDKAVSMFNRDILKLINN